MQVLTEKHVHSFILENLDLPEEDGSNFDHIVQALEHAGDEGFLVRAFRLSALEYGLPQRRIRLFFIGFNKATQGTASFKNIEKYLNGFKMKRQPPVAGWYVQPDSAVNLWSLVKIKSKVHCT